MKCKNCGKEIPDNAKFCANCGIDLNDETSNKVITKQNTLEKEIKLFNKVFTYEHAIVFGLSIIILISSVLPYVSISVFGVSRSINVLQMDSGFIFLIPPTLCIVFTYIRKEFFAMWTNLIGLFFTLYLFSYEISTLNDIGIGNLSIGAYLSLFCSIAIFIISCHLAIKFKKKKEERSKFENMMIGRFKIGIFAFILLVILLIILAIFQ